MMELLEPESQKTHLVRCLKIGLNSNYSEPHDKQVPAYEG